MSKSKKPWWKEKDKIAVIDHIQFIARNAESLVHRSDAQGFLDYFVRNGYMTPYMRSRGLELTKLLFPERLKEHSKRGKETIGKHYLYAISNGEHIKVGYSLNPKDRVKKLKTASPKPLKLVWQSLCGYSNREALSEEKKLHRRLKKHHVSGEWFEHDCIIICRNWRIKYMESKKDRWTEKMTDEQANIELDLEMLEQLNKNGHW